MAAYLVARSVLTRAWAGLCVLLTLLFPGLLLNTSSFLTDMPALSVDMACLALGVAALTRQGGGRWDFLATSMAVGCFAFSIREFSLAAPIAVLVATDRSRPASSAGVRGQCYLRAGDLRHPLCLGNQAAGRTA